MQELSRRVGILMRLNAVIEAKNLQKSFADKKVVRGLDFVVKSGQCFGFLGPNGAGKTTTLRMIEGVSPISGGKLKVFDYIIPEQGKQARRKLGIVPQMDNLDPDFTVIENLRMYGLYFGVEKNVLEQRISELLEYMQLSDRVNDKPDNLSGGMKRRLTIARALVNDPDLIILDEPTTGLDPQVRHLIWARLRELVKAGKTLLLTTHYMDEAERLCDELVIIDNGCILDQGSPKDIIQRNVEHEVLEIRGDLAQAKTEIEVLPNIVSEQHGDTLFCYSDNVDNLVQQFANNPAFNLLKRSCNLEDVFLRLTGRELRE